MQNRRRILATGAAALMTPQVWAREMRLTPEWEFVADGVMGGASQGWVTQETVQDRQAARLRGTVSLENNGGFIQMAFDLANGGVFDASQFTGVALDIRGNDELYDLRVRTDELRRPWHSYRTEVSAKQTWHTVRVPFSQFMPHNTDIPLNLRRLRRIGVLAIGRVFEADVAVARIGFY